VDDRQVGWHRPVWPVETKRAKSLIIEV